MSTTWWQDLYSDIDNQRIDSMGARLAEDIVFTMGGNPPVEGRDAVVAGQIEFFKSMRSLSHKFVNTWEADGSTLLESVVTYVRHDGRAVEVPGLSILTRRGELVDNIRVYIDLAPLYA